MNKNILVIDDDMAVRRSFTLAFEDTPYSVDTAESGEKGIHRAQNTKYDLIFLDLKMPGMDGVQTLRELRKMDRDVHIYIITGFHEEFVGQLKNAEVDGIDFELLRKPLDSVQLVSIARGILEGPSSY